MTDTAPAGPVARFRLRLAAACALLVGIAMAQSPGLLVADTKLDLAVAPGRFLLRAVHLWDPLGALGQLQNQAYGYLWPMGPFFLGGSELGVPEWAVQRLWLGLVLCVALVGAARLARELGVRSDLACIVAGFAYALSPRMLSTLGQISIEAWPSSLAPWVLLPLVIGSTRGSARRAAAWSAIAVAMVGGVNAAATFAVIPLGVVWLLTRGRGSRRTSMMLWWPVFTVLATLWWLVPLFVLGTYSPPFLDFIESASNTTFPTTIYDSLRGTSNWVVYLGATSRAGNDLLRDPILIINSAVVMVLGLFGILHRRNPERLFMVLSLLLGMLMVTMGHTGSVQGWFAEGTQDLLDGVLAPLRNVHKFDPIIRLPMVLGLAWTIDLLVARLRAGASPDADRTTQALRRFNYTAVLAAAVIAVGGAAIPAGVGRITPTGGFTAIPDYWSDTTAWLHDRDAAALMLPGSSFGDYIWGFPQDEPIQPLGRSPWAVRNAVPLTPAGNIRMLDAIEERMAQGHGSTALASYLRRAGVTHLVVRNDIDRAGDIPDPVLVHQALAQSPGIFRVKSFGPDIGGSGHIESEDGSRIVVNGGWQTQYPAIEVYAVVGAAASEGAETSQVTPVVVGGPEDLLDLTELGILDDEPTRLAFDVPTGKDPDAPLILTDGLRAVERHFGRLHDGRSATLAHDDIRRLANPTRDYLPDGSDPWVTWADYVGIDGVGASSSSSDVTTPGAVERGRLPYAAIDGQAETFWQAGRAGSDAWWEVRLRSPIPADEIAVTAGPDDPEVVRVTAGGATTEPVTIQPGATRTISLDGPAGDTIRIEDASGRFGHLMSLAEVAIPGVSASRELVLPAVPQAWGAPDRIALRAVSDARTGCAEIDSSLRCVPGRDVAGEESLGFRRLLTLPTAASYDEVQLRASGRPGDALLDLVQKDALATVTASSSSNPDLRSSALAAIDGDPGTTWSAALSDLNPRLDLRWVGARKVSGVTMRLLPDADARLPNEVQLTWPGGRRTVSVSADGDVRFRPIRTDQLTITVLEADPAGDLGFDRSATAVPVGISELELVGVPYFPRPPSDAKLRTPCGSGPEITVAGTILRTDVVTTARALYDGEQVTARVCGNDDVDLPAGRSRVGVEASELFAPDSLVLSNGTEWDAGVAGAAVKDVSPVELEIEPTAAGGVLSLHQNTNPGWAATQDTATLKSVVVDGWRQAWQLDNGASVRATFTPDVTYQAGLLGGGLSLLLLLLATAIRWRPWRDTSARPVRPATYPASVVAVIGLVVGGLLAGWVGFVLAAGAAVIGAMVGRRSPAVVAALVCGVMVPAAAAYALRPWGDQAGWAGNLSWPHYLVVFALCLIVGGVLEPGRRRLRSRSAGRSTTR